MPFNNTSVSGILHILVRELTHNRSGRPLDIPENLALGEIGVI